MEVDDAWPAAALEIESRPFPGLPINDDDPDTVQYQMSIPPDIAGRSVGPLTQKANTALQEASANLSKLQSTTTRSGIALSDLLVGALIRLEAVSSSQIENIDASNEEVLLHGAGHGPANTELGLVADNVRIVSAAITKGAAVRPGWIKDLHATLMDGSDLPAHLIGEWRDCPVWIGPTRATAHFEGPPSPMIADLIDDLVAFCARFDLNPIVQAAIAHAQFETIHPFADGNGRVGRAIIHPLLNRAAPTVVVPTAHALLTNRTQYFAGLEAYRSGDLSQWVTLFAGSVAAAASAAIRVTDQLQKLRIAWDREISTHRDGTARVILDRLPSNPVITIADTQQLTKVTHPAASQALNKLEASGVLRRVNTPGRTIVWVAAGVVEAIDSLNLILGERDTGPNP